jgi:RimJ/RimL family protein N-acetyltransferase
MVTIETARLRLRIPRPSDLEDFFGILGDPQVARYVGNGQPATREETETALTSIIDHWKRHGFGRWIAMDLHTDKLIGYGGLRSLLGTPEVVYHFGSSHWGKGLATEMARAALRYGFEEHRFERIVAIAKPANAASIRVMEKIGMKYERHACYYGVDVVQYGIRQHEFLVEAAPYLLAPAG